MKEEVTPEKKENVTPEISILKRNLRLLKRIVLGKKTPPLFLRILCWANLGWSLLMILFYGFIGMLIAIQGDRIKEGAFEEVIKGAGSNFFFSYALLHIIAIFGVILMWRKKKGGFYTYSIVTLLMPFWLMIITRVVEFDFTTLIFSLVAIGLFALNWNSLNLKRPKADSKEE